MMSFVQVAIPVPVRRSFTYKIPQGMDVNVGDRLFVPFGKRNLVGFAIGKNAKCEEIKIKEILEKPDIEQVFSEKMVELIRWMADYYFVPVGEMFKSAIPNLLLKNSNGGRKKTRNFEDTIIDGAFYSELKVTLTDEQDKVYNELKKSVLDFNFSTTLLHGVTGSGKTEVYIRLFEDVIGKGKSVIFLVPEIGMTPQTVGRITSYFKDKVSVYHSDLTDARRLHEWDRMKNGEAQIVVGTRSAVFAPFKKLGLIVVDEEHDQSYKQDENPRYNGRDTAVMRAKIEGISCLLGSATPSVDSFANVKKNKYQYLTLTGRPTGVKMPEVEIVDMKEVPKGVSLSPQLISEMAATRNRREQSMLFINRRGFASFVLCEDCGTPLSCPNCNITLAYHRSENCLICHYCDTRVREFSRCKKCGSSRLKMLGTGTEKIEDEIRNIFPDAVIERLDRDVTSKVGARSKVLSKMKLGQIDILIGTQMITKGHDFSNVSLVGVLDADLSLNFPDFRAAERAFQLITQVSGRAGRSDRAGKVIVQTYMPNHYSIQSAKRHDFFEFCNNELPMRDELSYPPFGKLILIKISGTNGAKVGKFAEYLVDNVKKDKALNILGPTQAPIARLRNKYRWQILLKSKNIDILRKAAEAFMKLSERPLRGIKVAVDVDPINML